MVNGDYYVTIIVFLHTTPAYPNPCYVMMTVDRGSTSTIYFRNLRPRVHGTNYRSVTTAQYKIREFCATTVVMMQGLFVLFARVGSSDPVRVLRLFHNKYSGYCCIHLLCKAMYNLSLPRLSANYYGLPTTVQLWATHKSRCSLFGVSRSTAVRYCTVPALNGILLGPFNDHFCIRENSL